MRIKVGYYYNCGKCGTRLNEDVNFLLYSLNPIRFDYLIKECPSCNTKYISHNLEFFTVTKKDFYRFLITSLATWVVFLNVVIVFVISEFISEEMQTSLLTCVWIIFNFLFVAFYCVSFKRRWENAIQKSIKRFNNEEYIFDLLRYGILDLESITYSYNNGIISEKTYCDTLYNIHELNENKKQSKEKL